jgi:hypothetical protein
MYAHTHLDEEADAALLIVQKGEGARHLLSVGCHRAHTQEQTYHLHHGKTKQLDSLWRMTLEKKTLTGGLQLGNTGPPRPLTPFTWDSQNFFMDYGG